jgi:tetratricopeptide (TPR) repeat protein
VISEHTCKRKLPHVNVEKLFWGIKMDTYEAKKVATATFIGACGGILVLGLMLAMERMQPAPKVLRIALDGLSTPAWWCCKVWTEILRLPPRNEAQWFIVPLITLLFEWSVIGFVFGWVSCCMRRRKNIRREAFLHEGIELVQLGHQEEAIAAFTKALKVDSLYALAYYNRAVVLESIGKCKEAFSDYNKVIEYDSGNQEARASRERVWDRYREQLVRGAARGAALKTKISND